MAGRSRAQGPPSGPAWALSLVPRPASPARRGGAGGAQPGPWIEGPSPPPAFPLCLQQGGGHGTPGPRSLGRAQGRGGRRGHPAAAGPVPPAPPLAWAPGHARGRWGPGSGSQNRVSPRSAARPRLPDPPGGVAQGGGAPALRCPVCSPRVAIRSAWNPQKREPHAPTMPSPGRFRGHATVDRLQHCYTAWLSAYWHMINSGAGPWTGALTVSGGVGPVRLHHAAPSPERRFPAPCGPSGRKFDDCR